MFDYDNHAPLNIQDIGSETRGNVLIRDITFTSPRASQPIAAYLIAPTNATLDCAGILYVHWYEPHAATSNPTQFIDEAVKMAELGTISLLVSTMWSDPEWFNLRQQSGDYQDALYQVIAFRCALDVLLAQPNVNPGRIAYVGHDFGAMYGSLLASAETRVQSYVLIAGTPEFYDWFVFNNRLEGQTLASYQTQIGAIDPVKMLATAKDISILFQFGEEDFYTPRDKIIAFYVGAPEPKRLATYHSGHDMEHAIIQHDRINFLRTQLRIP